MICLPGGNDYVEATSGGNDIIRGGDGTDVLDSGNGSDTCAQEASDPLVAC